MTMITGLRNTDLKYDDSWIRYEEKEYEVYFTVGKQYIDLFNIDPTQYHFPIVSIEIKLSGVMSIDEFVIRYSPTIDTGEMVHDVDWNLCTLDDDSMDFLLSVWHTVRDHLYKNERRLIHIITLPECDNATAFNDSDFVDYYKGRDYGDEPDLDDCIYYGELRYDPLLEYSFKKDGYILLRYMDGKTALYLIIQESSDIFV